MTFTHYRKLTAGDQFRARDKVWTKIDHQQSVDGFLYNAVAEDVDRVLPVSSFYVRFFDDKEIVHIITKAKHE